MGRIQCGLHVLSVLAFAGCDDINYDGAATWAPWDSVDGMFRPELVPAAFAPASKVGVRVVSYNVLYGIELEQDTAFFQSNPALRDADVISLQESMRRADDEISDAGQLAARLGMGYVFVPTWEDHGDLLGVSMLSRFPLRDVEVMLLTMQAEIPPEHRTARSALRATIDTPSGPLTVVNVHLDVPLDVPERVLQLRPAVIDPPDRVVVMGDFNTNDYVWGFDTLPVLPLDASAKTSQAESLDSYMHAIDYDTPTADFGATWHGPPEDQRLDSIFTHGLATGRGGVEHGLDTSDHRPIWLDVTP